jgi:hypothetical protein
LKRPTIALGLLITLALVFSMVMAVPVMGASPAFTGDVEADFPTGPDFLTFPDPDGQNVWVPGHPGAPISSGWDIKDVRVTYDSATDILYVGLNSYQTVGDADTDGGEGTMTYGAGVDVLNLGAGESVSVYFDLDQDGNWDVIAGVSDSANFSGFTITTAGGTYPSLAFFDTPTLTAHLGTRHWTPGTAPDLEFQILDFSTLPNQGGELGAFHIGAFMGSLVDDFTEDTLDGTISPAIDVEKLVSKDNVNFYDADTAGAALGVNPGDSVYFKYIVTNTGNVTLTNITLSDDTHDVSGITKTDPLALDASFNGTIGPITALSGLQTDIATATGDLDGFTVQDTDPANYSSMPDVGGDAFLVNKWGLMAPWAVLLLGCAGIVTLLVLRKRRQA